MKIFVSYAGDGKEVGRRIVAQCNGSNIDANAYDLRIMSHGRPDLDGFIENELQKFEMVIVVWSKEYAEDPWLQRELFSILAIERERRRSFVIPVCVDKHPLHALLTGKAEVIIEDEIVDGINEVVRRIPLEDQIFVVMALGDPELNSIFKTVIVPTGAKFDFAVKRVDEKEDSESISQEIFRLIRNSSIILCDITNDRPNVYFETGYALGLNRQIILTCREGT
ncbi:MULTISPECIES: toll/interleukin-1 receptor domain-containing protein [unclassified Paracoccus (in: a-proteobacteria)]|uniref:toll/interleukin-1 receptor domain-containing protein n=1 Tax=unclassified Paracoccus (in: a-proteobacteria) TaxID=2688777 RepID=UPI0016014B05|nr:MULTISPECIES: toll/interleukin-1 receptor domain-containing protein [unclassified Paracoccus (in: a-proteobacteria)]MBB1490716.1 toll/interleukin-1 receptor domain-containing protein [Paracoccus sp. MC1854]MBB1497441.1 toll/interleukin-1 receptor domain-containing protein [Paracoccus sp. MC1862]QQO45926.1 toll/interleukin-1 receptor domain-containing protein [Paracoccus sp. MC1862]